jgi:hypothetical protein
MIGRHLWIAIGGVVALAGCAADSNRQWMKVGHAYTTEEFRRDHAACTTNKRLDEACMRSRGWVDVSPSKEDTKTPELEQRPRPTYAPSSPSSPPRR